jgi:hypothetical protein
LYGSPVVGASSLTARLRRTVATLAGAARRQPWELAAALVAWATLCAVVGIVLSPWLGDLSTYGFHDWDAATSFRYLVKVSLLRYHEFPGWNPYACGGYPSWGYIESATVLVSPWLPAYLLLPLSVAIRVEALGMGLLGAVGAYVLAGAFTKSRGARLLVVALWAVNGRWGLQTASGHPWHLAYAWTPWCLYFYELARQRRGRLGPVVGAGACFALLVYAGAIYPLPHTVLLVGCYALLCTLQERSLRPLLLLAAAGSIGIGLSAPKLLPLLDTFAGDPRLIPSTEQLDLGAFVTLLTSRDQGFFSRPARVQPYGWHEWGMYISSVGLGVLGLGFVLVEGRRERALKIVGALLLVLGFGAFHRYAPWTLLHQHAPFFRSQHVPSRFLYPAVLVLALVAAIGLGRLVERRRHRAPWLDLAVALAVAWLAVDVARVAQLPMTSAMWMVPPTIPEGRTFHHAQEPPFQYKKRDWAGPVLLAMMGNTGVLNCYGVPRSPERPIAPLPRGDSRYRGELYLEGTGRAELTAWSPNHVSARLSDVGSDATLLYNMNYRNGWRSDAGKVFARHGLIAVRVPPGARSVELWYRPPGLGLGLLVAALTAAALFGLAWLRHRELGSARPEGAA